MYAKRKKYRKFITFIKISSTSKKQGKYYHESFFFTSEKKKSDRYLQRLKLCSNEVRNIHDRYYVVPLR